MQDYAQKIENQLRERIQIIIDMLLICISKTVDTEALTFYNKTIADNYRYLCEFEEDDALDKALAKANQFYQKA